MPCILTQKGHAKPRNIHTSLRPSRECYGIVSQVHNETRASKSSAKMRTFNQKSIKMKTPWILCRFIHKSNIKCVKLLGHIQFEDSSCFLYFQLEIPSSRLQSVTIKIVPPCSFYHFRNWTNIIPSKWWAERKNVSPASTMVSFIFGINSLNFGRVPRYTWTVWIKKTPLQKIAGLTYINLFKGDFCWTVGHLWLF